MLPWFPPLSCSRAYCSSDCHVFILLLLYRYRPRKDSIRKFQEFHFYVLNQQKVLEVSEGLGNIAPDGECEEVLVLFVPMDNKC